ncbi:lipid-A-disaccharide synthase N-terminal domain-containing protein [Harenicola maris]
MDSLFVFLNVQTWTEFWWVVIGLGGQMLFTARFLVQWIASERARRSVVPLSFWYFSILGGLILLAYAIYRKDPVFILGQSTGLAIYGRNLWLIHNERNA